jgi:hypothetical protein
MRILPGVQIIVCVFCAGFEANAGEEANYDIEHPLEEFWVTGCQVRIIDIEYGKKSGHQTVDLVWFERAPYPQFLQPLPCNGVHKDIEQLIKEGATLCDAPPRLKWRAVINRCSAYHCCILPEVLDQSNHHWSYTIPAQN